MIRFDNVPKAYKVRRHWKPVFDTLNFAINRGDAVGICGASGAAKSTLMRMLAGVEPETAGKITRKMAERLHKRLSNGCDRCRQRLVHHSNLQ